MRIVSAVAILIGLLSSRAFAAPTACSLIPAAEMSAILGSTVGASADDRGGSTKCTYEIEGGELGGAYAEVELSWGGGVAGMAGVGLVKPDAGRVVGELAGLGDQATSVGPMTVIRRGSDLITLVVSGVGARDHDSAITKRIYGLLDERLPKPTAP